MKARLTPEIAIRAFVADDVSDEDVFRLYKHLHAQGHTQPMPSEIIYAARELGIPTKPQLDSSA